MLVAFLVFFWLLSGWVIAQAVVASCKTPDPLVEDREARQFEVKRLNELWKMKPYEGSERV